MGSDAPAKDIVAALAAQRTRVTAQQVYMVKAQLGKQESNGDSSYSAILAAKQLVDKVGSVKAAQEALAVLAKLQ